MMLMMMMMMMMMLIAAAVGGPKVIDARQPDQRSLSQIQICVTLSISTPFFRVTSRY
jgi:hypothetical protein